MKGRVFLTVPLLLLNAETGSASPTIENNRIGDRVITEQNVKDLLGLNPRLFKYTDVQKILNIQFPSPTTTNPLNMGSVKSYVWNQGDVIVRLEEGNNNYPLALAVIVNRKNGADRAQGCPSRESIEEIAQSLGWKKIDGGDNVIFQKEGLYSLGIKYDNKCIRMINLSYGPSNPVF